MLPAGSVLPQHSSCIPVRWAWPAGSLCPCGGGTGCHPVPPTRDSALAGPDVVCRWWSAAVAMSIGWLRGDDAAVRSHFTEVERVPKSLEMSECVGFIPLPNSPLLLP